MLFEECPGVIINMSTGVIGNTDKEISGPLACMESVRPEISVVMQEHSIFKDEKQWKMGLVTMVF